MQKEVEIMRVFRVPPLGKLVVEVSGRRFEKLSEINHAKVEQRLLTAIGELVSFAGGYQSLLDAGVAPPLPGRQALSSAEGLPVDDPELALRQARFLSSLEKQRDVLRHELPLSYSTDLASALAAADVSTLKPAAERSLADQIDAILQKHLMSDPELANRAIRLRENPSGGLRIEVDGHFYDRPREVPELAIQQLIKTALREWEAL